MQWDDDEIVRLREVARRKALTRRMDAPTAEDLAQEAVSRLLAQDSMPPNPDAWIRLVVNNLVVDGYRQGVRIADQEVNADAPPPGFRWPGPSVYAMVR